MSRHHVGRCSFCGKSYRIPSGSWDANRFPKCPSCRVRLEMSDSAWREKFGRPKSAEKRRCAKCGAFLRAGNLRDLCWSCEFGGGKKRDV